MLRDGTVQPVSALDLRPDRRRQPRREGGHYTSASFTAQFQELLDVSQVTAVRVGDVTIPLA